MQVHAEEVTLKPRFSKSQEKRLQNEIYSPGPMILNFLPVELQQMDFCRLNYQVGGIRFFMTSQAKKINIFTYKQANSKGTMEI